MTAENSTENSKPKRLKLSDEDLKGRGKMGKGLLVLRKAFIWAKSNNCSGTVLEKSKKPDNVLYTKSWKTEDENKHGSYWALSEEDEFFIALYEKAKNAKSSIDKLEYDQNIIDLINFFNEIPSQKGRKVTRLEPNSLKDIKL